MNATGIAVSENERTAIEYIIGIESVDQMYSRLEASSRTQHALNTAIRKHLIRLDEKTPYEPNDHKTLEHLLSIAKREYSIGNIIIEEGNTVLDLLERAEAPTATMLGTRIQARRNILQEKLICNASLQYKIISWLDTL